EDFLVAVGGGVGGELGEEAEEAEERSGEETVVVKWHGGAREFNARTKRARHHTGYAEAMFEIATHNRGDGRSGRIPERSAVMERSAVRTLHENFRVCGDGAALGATVG